MTPRWGDFVTESHFTWPFETALDALVSDVEESFRCKTTTTCASIDVVHLILPGRLQSYTPL